MRQLFFVLFVFSLITAIRSTGDITFRFLRFESEDTKDSPCNSFAKKTLSNCQLRVTLCVGTMRKSCDLLKSDLLLLKDKSSFDWSTNMKKAPSFVLTSAKLPTYIFLQVTFSDYDRQSRKNGDTTTFYHSFSPKLGTTSYDLQSESDDEMKELEIQVHAECAKNYYRKRCEKFCLPKFQNQYCSKDGQLYCNHGWFGKNCSFESCLSSNRCQNGATCEQTETGRKCICSLGFEGLNCEINNPCIPSPCQNDGKCERIAKGNRNQFLCKCRKFFIGDRCQKQKDLCKGVKCLNGGICKMRKSDSSDDIYPYCQCQVGFTGRKCEKCEICTTSSVITTKFQMSNMSLMFPVVRSTQDASERRGIKTGGSQYNLNTAVTIVLVISGVLFFLLVTGVVCIYKRRLRAETDGSKNELMKETCVVHIDTSDTSRSIPSFSPETPVQNGVHLTDWSRVCDPNDTQTAYL